MSLNIPTIFKRGPLLKDSTRAEDWSINDLEFATQVAWKEITGISGIPTGIFFKPDGKKMYVIENDSQFIRQFDLENPWELSGILTLEKSEAVISFPDGLYFKPDGTKIFWADSVNGDLVEVTLGTAWDIATMGAETTTAVAKPPIDISFNRDGSKCYTTSWEALRSDITEHVLTNPWDISAITSSTTSDIAEDTRGSYFRMSPNRRKIILYGTTSNNVFEYETRAATNVDSPKLIIINDFSNKRKLIENPDVSGMFINQQGTRAYFSTAAGEEAIIQYNFKEKESDPR